MGKKKRDKQKQHSAEGQAPAAVAEPAAEPAHGRG